MQNKKKSTAVKPRTKLYMCQIAIILPCEDGIVDKDCE